MHAKSDRLKAVVADVASQALNAERIIPAFKRTRARRPADLAVFLGTVEALVCHAAYEYLRGAGLVRLSLSKQNLARASRYLSPLQSKQLPTIVRLLSSPDLGFLTFKAGEAPTPFSPGRQTRIGAGPRLVSRLHGIDLDDIGRRDGEEVILLKGDRDDVANASGLVEYDDTTDTFGYRSEVQKINAHLVAADIEYVGSTPLVDERSRHLVRRFTRAYFGSGGRLWGGFWQRLQKADRLANVRISGERVVSVDYASMIARIAYAYAGTMPPPGDLYGFTFKGAEGSPVVLPRGVVKKIFAARLNGAKDWPEELRQHRAGLPWRCVVAGLKEAHAPIAAILDRDLGQAFAFTESEILVDVLLRLIEKDVTALPVHDCIVVAESDLADAERVMLDSFKFHTRQPGCVAIERAP